MKRLGIRAIELEIRFPDRYPINPPFIRILYPRFQFRTGHITMGGSICMELLTNKGWSAVCSLENIIYDIKTNIIEGDGQIDVTNYGRRYTFEEAKEAFNRMVQSHGW
jgi:ubiquitin-conjugating enzyme E2 Q